MYIYEKNKFEIFLDKVWLSSPTMHGEELKYITEAFESNWMSTVGENINELDEQSIRGNITIISQNPYVFNLSIRDNLKLVKEELIEEEMREACRIACLDDFIKSLPNKYDTILKVMSNAGAILYLLLFALALVGIFSS